MTTENKIRVATVRRVCVSRSSVISSRPLCRITEPNNSTSRGRMTSYWAEALTSGSGLSGASKLMTSLPVTVAVLSSMPAVSNASLERCMESRELVNGESRDTVSHVTPSRHSMRCFLSPTVTRSPRAPLMTYLRTYNYT